MDRTSRRKTAQTKAKRIRSFYGKKAKVSKRDLEVKRKELQEKGQRMMSKKLLITLAIVLLLLFGLTYIGYFR